MKRFLGVLLLASAVLCLSSAARAQEADGIGKKTEAYFAGLFGHLKTAAEQDPTVENFRKVMRPVAEQVEGFYDATLISPDFVIKQVYHASHFLARGFDLKKVSELSGFYAKMRENPAPQLSEPGHGGVMQPKLIAMRYPVVKDGKLKNIVSMMVRTEAYLKASGLDECRAFRIICLGKVAEQRGAFSGKPQEVTLALPSTEWVIQYEK